MLGPATLLPFALVIGVAEGSAEPADKATAEPQEKAETAPVEKAEAEPEEAKAEPEEAKAKPEEAKAEPEEAKAEPEEAKAEPEEAKAEPEEEAEAEPEEQAEAEPEADAIAEPDDRKRRRRGRRARDEGEWRVFAPYPELGPIRYRDPEVRRTLWLGVDASGVVIPTSVGLFDRTVWTIRPGGAWALALAPWLAVGGRHSVAWYDADNIRLRVHAHQLELSGRPLAGSRPDAALDDRLAVGVTTHAIRNSEVGGFSLQPGGLSDTIIHLGYGLDHLLGTRWRLGWKVQGRYAWVYRDTQRHVRASLRLAFNPRPPHRLSLDAVGYYVHRDPQQAGVPLPRSSVFGQFALGYAWISRAGIGPWTQVRATTGFLGGEAPVYEIREEALSSMYGEMLVGVLARWP